MGENLTIFQLLGQFILNLMIIFINNPIVYDQQSFLYQHNNRTKIAVAV